MISHKLLRHIEDHAGRLTTDLVQALQENPRTYAYRSIPPERLIELKGELYEHLGRWLSGRTRFALESRYRKLGRERYLSGIPLSQVICALNLTKSVLLNFIRRSTPGEPGEFHLAHELEISISKFFDEAIYFASVGYEDAYQASLAAPQAEIAKTAPVRGRRQAGADVESAVDLDLPISRAGDIGEASG